MTRQEIKTISEIIDRMENIEEHYGSKPMQRITRVMDLCNAHEQCPLDLIGLLNAPSSDFVHDVMGISNHMNRETGKLENCFLPRLSSRPAATGKRP